MRAYCLRKAMQLQIKMCIVTTVKGRCWLPRHNKRISKQWVSVFVETYCGCNVMFPFLLFLNSVLDI